MQRILFVASILLAILSLFSGCKKADINTLVALPAKIYAVQGQEMAVFFDNIILSQETNAYDFHVVCDIGAVEQDRWVVIPAASDLGDHDFSITLSDNKNNELCTVHSLLHVSSSKSKRTRPVYLLMIGDSLTQSGDCPKKISEMFKQNNDPPLYMLGSNKLENNVAHEGYGALTWESMASAEQSPFVYDGKIQIKKYLDEYCDGNRPDIITIMLGLNDTFYVNHKMTAELHDKIHLMLYNADRFLKALRKELPEADIGVCLTIPSSIKDESFENIYGSERTRLGWRKIQRRLLERQVQHFYNKENDHIYIVPTGLNLDVINGYGSLAVHTNELGYDQIAQSIYAWIKSRLK